MGNALRKSNISEQAYLADEPLAPYKSEFVDGQVYAMAGASARHNRISGNLYIKLDAAIRGSRCEVFIADMKVKVESHRSFYYPDVMLSCPQPGDDHPLYRCSPCLIAEILSPSTAKIDEREKWLHYRDIPSLRYYLLIDSESRYARILSRDAEGWLEQTLDEEEVCSLECDGINARFCLDDLYDRTGLRREVKDS